eukprot:3853717-Rhodomonas_salina.2
MVPGAALRGPNGPQTCANARLREGIRGSESPQTGSTYARDTFSSSETCCTPGSSIALRQYQCGYGATCRRIPNLSTSTEIEHIPYTCVPAWVWIRPDITLCVCTGMGMGIRVCTYLLHVEVDNARELLLPNAPNSILKKTRNSRQKCVLVPLVPQCT